MHLYKLEEVEGEIRAVPFADHIKVAKCADPGCPHTHLLLCTSDGRPYTVAVLSEAQLVNITVLADQIRAEKQK